MTQEIMWSLLVAFAAIAIGAILKMAEALHGKKLSDDECSRLRAQLDIFNNPKNKEPIDVQPLNSSEAKEPQEPLDETREKILSILAKSGGSTKNEIAVSLKINPELAAFHLNELLYVDFVHHPAPYAPSETWSIAQDGRAYLVRHGLL